MLSIMFIGTGLSIFFASWCMHDRFPTTKETYLELGRFAFWVFVFGIILLSAGI